MALGVTSYNVVEGLHVIAVLVAFGLPLGYPVLLPYLRRHHAESLAGIHDAQLRMNQRMAAPATVAIVLLGAYLASKNHLWGQVWVDIPIGIIVVIGGVGGAVINPSLRRLSELAGAGGAEYERVYRRYMRAEILLGVLVVVAAFCMAARP